VPEGKCYWPGRVEPGFDPIVPAEQVQQNSINNMVRSSDPRGPQWVPTWRGDPTYNLKGKGKVRR